eukprot:scaffold54510_cov53-Cyclotella_meneghiniana.AAC.2
MAAMRWNDSTHSSWSVTLPLSMSIGLFNFNSSEHMSGDQTSSNDNNSNKLHEGQSSSRGEIRLCKLSLNKQQSTSISRSNKVQKLWYSARIGLLIGVVAKQREYIDVNN